METNRSARERILYLSAAIIGSVGITLTAVAACTPDPAPAPPAVVESPAPTPAPVEPVTPSLPTLHLPPCPTEDSDDCYWDADVMGNGGGTDFITVGGVTYYPAN